MRRPTKLQLQIMRTIKAESAVRMRARISAQAFLRSIFWQGENCGQPVDEVMDRALQQQAVTEQLKHMRQRSTQLA